MVGIRHHTRYVVTARVEGRRDQKDPRRDRALQRVCARCSRRLVRLLGRGRHISLRNGLAPHSPTSRTANAKETKDCQRFFARPARFPARIRAITTREDAGPGSSARSSSGPATRRKREPASASSIAERHAAQLLACSVTLAGCALLLASPGNHSQKCLVLAGKPLYSQLSYFGSISIDALASPFSYRRPIELRRRGMAAAWLA